jgi:hypothetical protein
VVGIWEQRSNDNEFDGICRSDDDGFRRARGGQGLIYALSPPHIPTPLFLRHASDGWQRSVGDDGVEVAAWSSTWPPGMHVELHGESLGPRLRVNYSPGSGEGVRASAPTNPTN